MASKNQNTTTQDAPSNAFVMVPMWLMDMMADAGSIITCAHVAVYMTIRRHWSPERPLPWPELATIARESGIGLTRVKVLVRELEAVGAIRRISRGRKRGSGGRCSNRYELAGMNAPLPIFSEDSSGTNPTTSATPERVVVGGVTSTERGCGRTDDRDLEPQIQEQDQQGEKRCDTIASDGAAAHDDDDDDPKRKPITDRATIDAAEYLFDAIRNFSPDIEAATASMVVQRVVDTAGRLGCGSELPDALTAVADAVSQRARVIDSGQRPDDEESPVGFVMGVAEYTCRFRFWDPDEFDAPEYWGEVRTDLYEAVA